MKAGSRYTPSVKIDFSHGLLDPGLTANAYVNAASVTPLAVQQWGGVAGAFYNNLEPGDQTILENQWNALGKKIPPGSAIFAQDGAGHPYPFTFKNNKKRFIIHAGSPIWDSTQQAQIEQDLKTAYLEILKKINTHNTQNPTDQITQVAIPPLGIGIYKIPAKISAKCAHLAFIEFSKISSHPLEIVIPLHEGKNKNSKDFAFGTELNSLLHSTPELVQTSLVAHPKEEIPDFTELDHNLMVDTLIQNYFSKQKWDLKEGSNNYTITSKTDPTQNIYVAKSPFGVRFSGSEGSLQHIAALANQYQDALQKKGGKAVFGIDAQKEEDAVAFLVKLSQGGFNIDAIKSINCGQAKKMDESEMADYTHHLLEKAKSQLQTIRKSPKQ